MQHNKLYIYINQYYCIKLLSCHAGSAYRHPEHAEKTRFRLKEYRNDNQAIG